MPVTESHEVCRHYPVRVCFTRILYRELVNKLNIWKKQIFQKLMAASKTSKSRRQQHGRDNHLDAIGIKVSEVLRNFFFFFFF